MGRRATSTGMVVVAALLASLIAPALASASFHLMSIRAIFSGQLANNNGFVELQMYAPGQNLTGGHVLRYYDQAGSVFDTFTLPASNVPNGQSQRTVLIGDTSTSGADYSFTNIGNDLVTLSAGGAVCWETVDCASWGNFTGNADLPSSAGTPFPSPLVQTQVMARNISANCPSALDAADDTGDSASDFAFVVGFPVRGNAAAVTENTCPETFFRKRPKSRSRDRTPTFKFASSEAGSSFECKRDRGPFKPCSSPRTLGRLKPGKHTFAVRATDSGGATDPTPAVDSFRVLKKKHRRHRH
jgi:hypothetical protein